MNLDSRGFVLAIGVAIAGLFTACAGVEEPGVEASSDAGGAPDGGGMDAGGLDFGDAGLDFGDAGGPGDGGYQLDPDAACVSASAEAVLAYEPVDIIIAVDNSSSMKQEVTDTNANLNEFVKIIEQSQIDYRVVMIAKRGTHIATYPFEICIPPPLATADCGDGPRFLHVDEEIYSTKVLKQIWQTYKGLKQAGSGTVADPSVSWKSFLRVGARKHFLAITDDDSTTQQTDAAKFDQTMLALDPPMFQGYVFNAVCGLDKVACPSIANVGKAYITLAANTGGQTASICDSDWNALFRSLAQGVVQSTKLSCELEIPPPPPGKKLHTSKVSVIYTPGGGGAAVAMEHVANAAACTAAPGFYFDDAAAPTKIIVCPQTCPTLQGDGSGRVDVMFGCRAVLN